MITVMTEDPTFQMGEFSAAPSPNHHTPLLRSRFHEEFPDKNAAQIEDAIALAKRNAHPALSQDDLEKLVREYLSR